MITNSFRIDRGVRTHGSPVKSVRCWTREQDDKLLASVHCHGPQRWAVVSSKVDGRTSKQCRERWHNHLNPEINNNPWTETEDDTIMYSYQLIGPKWATIAKKLYGRTDHAVKKRFNAIHRYSKYEKGVTECNMFESSAREYEDEVTQLCESGADMVATVVDDEFLSLIDDIRSPSPSMEELAASEETCSRELALDLDMLLGDVPLAMESEPLTPKTPVMATRVPDSMNIDGDSIRSLFEKNVKDTRKPGVYFATKQPTVPCTIRKAVRFRMRSAIYDRPLKIRSNVF